MKCWVAALCLLVAANTRFASALCRSDHLRHDTSESIEEDFQIPQFCQNRRVITAYRLSRDVTALSVKMGRRFNLRPRLSRGTYLGEKGITIGSTYRLAFRCSPNCKDLVSVSVRECDFCSSGYGFTDCTVRSKRECTKCKDNKVSNGREACYRCPQGQVPYEQKSRCKECPEGSRSRNHICEFCEAGTYNDRKASTSCTACPEGFLCPIGTKSLKSCAEGYQLSTSGESESCKTCNDGFYCPDGTLSNPNKCPEGFFCNGGEKKPCGQFRFCPEGSIVEGPECFGVGTKEFNASTSTCVCRKGFTGEICETLDTSLGKYEFRSTQFGSAVMQFWSSEADGNCPCGMSYNGTTCLDELNSTLSVFTSIYSGIYAYEAKEYEVALQAMSRTVECVHNQDMVSEKKSMLEALGAYLKGQESKGFAKGEALTIQNQFYSVLIANELILALKHPKRSKFPIFFRPIYSAKRMMTEMLEPFAQCKTNSLLPFATGPSSVNQLEDLEAVLAMARCALLGVEELGEISLVPGEAFVTQALYTLASHQQILDTALGRAQILEIATFLDERDGPSPSIQDIFYLEEAAFRPFVAVGAAEITSVAARPVLFFEDNIGEKIDRIRVLASKIGSEQRSSTVISVINEQASALEKVVRESFVGLGDYMAQVNAGIMNSILSGAVADSSAAIEELEAKSDILNTGLQRIEASARKMTEYLTVLNSDRIEALLAAYNELVETQFDIEVAKAEIERARGFLGLFKGTFVGVASIGLTLAGGPMAGAALSAGAGLIPLRRRLLKTSDREVITGENTVEASTKELQGGLSDSQKQRGSESELRQNSRFLGVCGFQTSDMLKLLGALGSNAKSVAASISAKLSKVGVQEVAMVLSAVELTLGIVDLAQSDDVCDQSTDQDPSGSFGAFVRGVLGDSRSPATTGILLAIIGPEFASLEVDIVEAVKDFTPCLSDGRRLDSNETSLEMDIRHTSEQDRVLLCSAFGQTGFKFSKHISGISTTFENKLNSVSKAFGSSGFGKAMGVVGGFADIGIGVVGYMNANAEADARIAQAEDTKARNSEAVKEAVNFLKVALQKLSTAFVALALRFDMLQVGLPFDAIFSSSFTLGEDSFRLLPAVWDSIFHDIMDVLENEVSLCPQIQGTLSARRALSDRGADSGNLPINLRRSLISKAANQKKLKEANERYKAVSTEISNIHCPRFEMTLRQIVGWGTSIHTELFKFLEDYREFESLFAQTQQRANQVDAIEAQIKRQEEASVKLLKELATTNGEGAAITLIQQTNTIIANTQYKRTIVDTVAEAITLLQDFCSSHFYINPENIPAECVTDPRESLNFATPDYELLLLSLEDKMSRIKLAAKENWFEFAYAGFSDYDDELLTVTELIDWDDFKANGYSNIAFTLHGPPGEQEERNNSDAAARSGPAFCGFDNLGMSSFGVLFLDSDGNIISSTTQEVGVSVSLSGPFWKTVGGQRIGFSLKSYEQVPYSYSAPRTNGAVQYCRTDENPTLYGTICDKSRSFQISGEGLNSQPLPSPYARWEIEVVEGADLLRTRGAAGLAIVSSFKAAKADDQICIATRVPALEARVDDGKFVGGAETGAVLDDRVAASFLGGFGSSLLLLLLLAVALMVYRKLHAPDQANGLPRVQVPERVPAKSDA